MSQLWCRVYTNNGEEWSHAARQMQATPKLVKRLGLHSFRYSIFFLVILLRSRHDRARDLRSRGIKFHEETDFGQQFF